MNTEIWQYSLYLFGGILAGSINTLSGGGNNLTFSLMLLFGVPANIANGTNRLGILLQNLWGSYTFYQNNLLNLRDNIFFIVPSVIGAIFGAFVAVDIDLELLENIVGVFMLLLIPTVFKKKKTEQVLTKKKMSQKKQFFTIIVFLAIGFYGGLVQGGIALVLVPLLSGIAGMGFIRANAVKMLITLVYTFPVFWIFVYYQQVDWALAILLSIGQILGTRLASSFAINNPNANQVARWLLVIMLFLTVLQLFDVIKLPQ